MNCIRCGRRIAEGKTFCDECAGVVREPLPDSPYTSLHIALPKRTDQPRPARKPVEQPEKKKPRSRRYHRMVRAIVSLALVCAVLAGCCAFGVYYYLTHYQRDRNRLRVQAEELDRQAASAAQTATELAEAQDDLAAAQEELASQARDIDRLEQQVNTYQMQGAQNEQSLRELQEENLRLVDENADYATQIDALNAQLSKLNSRVSTLQDSNAARSRNLRFSTRTSPLWRTTARIIITITAAPTSKSRATGPTASTSPSRGAIPPVPIAEGEKARAPRAK